MFDYRIADFMPVRNSYADMDDVVQAGYFQTTLNDLLAASPNGEITHVQLRIYWDYTRDAGMLPFLGSGDPPQINITNNFRRWLFGNPTPNSGKGAIQRIKEAGFKVEIGLSVSWGGDTVNIPPVFWKDRREADYVGFDGAAWVNAYYNNCLLPLAQECANSGLITAGDIFFIGFENWVASADHPTIRSSNYSNVINQLRSVLPAGVLINDHVTGWYNWEYWSNPSGYHFRSIPYFSDLDLLTPSMWHPWLQPPTPITRENFAAGHFNCIPMGNRNFMQDCQTLYDLRGTPIMWNSGMRQTIDCAYQATPESCYGSQTTQGLAEQAEFWAGRLLALKQAMDMGMMWVAGQDFERYCEPLSFTTYTASWRGRPAQAEIIAGINAITGGVSPGKGRLEVQSIPTQGKSVVIQQL